MMAAWLWFADMWRWVGPAVLGWMVGSWRHAISSREIGDGVEEFDEAITTELPVVVGS